MNSLTKTAAVLLLTAMAVSAHAASITGQINIQTGSVILNPNTLGTATSANAATGIVTSVEGSYPMSLIGDTASYSAFNFAVGPQAITPLWTVTDSGGGFTYSFNLTNISTFNQSSQQVFLAGSGMLTSSNANLTPTNGLWTYNITSADGSPTNGVFSFQSNNVAVPDGGSTLVLLGLSFFGTALIAARRKLVKS